MQDSAVIDSSGALIYSNALKRWNFVTEPQNYIARNANSPETSWMHLGYSNGELMGLRTDLVRFNLNETIIAVSYTHLDVYKRQILITAGMAKGVDIVTFVIVDVDARAAFIAEDLSLIHI